jgi:hypothetical protein
MSSTGFGVDRLLTQKYMLHVGSKRAVALGLVIGSLIAGCSVDRNFIDSPLGGGGGDSDGIGGGAAVAASGSGSKGGVSNLSPTGGGGVGANGGGAGGGGGAAPAATNMSACGADEYEDGGSCKKLTVCAGDEFEQMPPGAKQDRVCGKTRACSSNEFEASAPTADRDRVCSPLTVCPAGTRVSTPPTAATDRTCTPCASGSFSSGLNAASCATWSACKAGETESVPPSPTSDRVCSKCGSGKYEKSGECVALTVCGSSQYESTPATATSDRQCNDVKSCQPGNRQTAAPTATTDRQCAPCSSGTFSNQVNATSCKTWTVCGANQKQSAAGTPTSDVMCVDKPVCSTAADRACTIDCPCASGEGVCTNNNQCASGASCVAGSSKKVGRAGDTCLANHCNNDAQDSGETSVDCGGECGCRATYDVVVLKTLPASATGAELTTMSRDGKKLGGNISKSRTNYPALFALDGSVTALESYGKSGWIESASADGSVMLGGMGCSDPPTCSDPTLSAATWTGTAAPKVVYKNGTGRALSSSGTAFAGDYYDSGFGQNRGFIKNGNSGTTIPDLSYVAGMTPDAKYVAGTPQAGGVQAALWSAQTQTLTKIGSTSWLSTTINAINGTDPAIAGWGAAGSDVFIGFRWKGNTLTQLGVLSGGLYTTPAAISSDGGTVVGLTGTNSFQQAFIWTDKDKLRTIVDELRARGLELPVDLKLTNALFLSDDGNTIVGTEYTTPPSFWRVVLK